MLNPESKAMVLIVVAGMALVQTAIARVDVDVEFDKAFDFRAARTWAWHRDGPGEVKMARTRDDDPEAMRARAEPVIVEAVTTGMARRGMQPAAATPDLALTYYLLLTTNMSAQTMGQFLPATTQWGLPPFAPATQSLEVMNAGSLVLDMSASQTVVWRGVARAQIRIGTDARRREALLREAVRDLLSRFPNRS